jgi:hypothetical protein
MTIRAIVNMLRMFVGIVQGWQHDDTDREDLERLTHVCNGLEHAARELEAFHGKYERRTPPPAVNVRPARGAPS